MGSLVHGPRLHWSACIPCFTTLLVQDLGGSGVSVFLGLSSLFQDSLNLRPQPFLSADLKARRRPPQRAPTGTDDRGSVAG